MPKLYWIFMIVVVVVMGLGEGLKEYHQIELQKICLANHTPKECAQK